MAEAIMTMQYEFFSWRGFISGSSIIFLALIVQAWISFPTVWVTRPLDFTLFLIASALIIGFSSGSVLVFLFPPDQDVIGVAGLGSDNFSQHMALFLVILALVQPVFTGFFFFYEYFSIDPFEAIWVIVGFAAPSTGYAMAMFDRQNAIAMDLKEYFTNNTRLDMVSLDWLHGYGPRTAVYRMGMLEAGAARVGNLRLRGHEIVLEKDPYPIKKV